MVMVLIDREKLINALHEECKKDLYKEIPTWILNVIEKQEEVNK